MRPRPLSEIARAVEGAQEGDDVEVRSVSIDSRAVEEGSLFLALPGEPRSRRARPPRSWANAEMSPPIRRPDRSSA